MHVERSSDPAHFLSAAGPLLLEDEARHNLILGIAATLRDRPGTYPEFRLWVVADDDGRPLAAGLQTPPQYLLVAGGAEGVAALADVLAAERAALPGVTGAVPEVEAFAARWEASAGARARPEMRQRIYRLERLREVADVPGAARLASEADRDLLVAWIEAFSSELRPDVPPARAAELTVDIRLGGGDASGFLLWDDGEPVSLAGWGGPTPNGMRIGPVYTPPEHRRRGYGSAVTAAASARLLAGGRAFCFLYTDVTNPTSNKIYMDLGYEPVCDSVECAFEP